MINEISIRLVDRPRLNQVGKIRTKVITESFTAIMKYIEMPDGRVVTYVQNPSGKDWQIIGSLESLEMVRRGLMAMAIKNEKCASENVESVIKWIESR